MAALAALALLAVLAPAALADGSLQVSANPNPFALGATTTLDFSGTTPTTGANDNGPYRYSVVYLVQPGGGACPTGSSEDMDTRIAGGGIDSGTPFDLQQSYGANGFGDFRVCAWTQARDS